MRKPFALLAAAALVCGVQAQDARPLAIQNARILTMQNGVIDNGTLLVRNGAIEAVGTDVEIPAGYQVVDAGGGTVMPGLVSAWSHAGLNRATPPPAPRGRGRRGGRGRGRGNQPQRRGRASNQAATPVVQRIYPRQEVFGELLKAGVTTLALTPQGSGFPGTGAILNPAGKTLEELTTTEEAFLVVSPAANNAAKTVLKEAFEAAQKLVEQRNQPPEPPAEEPDPEATDEAKTDEEKTTDEEQETQPPEEEGRGRGRGRRGRSEPTPHDEAIADLLQGKKRAFLSLNTANDVVHYLDAVGDINYPTTVVTSAAGGRGGGGGLELVLDKIVAMDAIVLMQPSLGTHPNTTHVSNPPAAFHQQGLEIGFLLGDNRQNVEDLFFRMMDLVRHGLPADVALAGVTRVPAKSLGVDDRVGSLSPGKDADLLLFSGDPLNPESRLIGVWHKGLRVREEK